MKDLAFKSLAELKSLCACTQAAFDGEESMCEACQVVGAIDAGIPRSVIAGKTALTDHFSQSYIDYKCGRKPNDVA